MILGSLLRAYRRHGFLARTGLNPLYFDDPDCPFTHFQRANGEPISVGGGLAPQELQFLEGLCEGSFRPRTALVIGNAFGWSAIALGMILPESVIVAMDAGLEGNSTELGASLTTSIAEEEGLSVRVVDALSPRDIPRVVSSAFGGAAIDFVLVDGFHTNDQLTRDFMGVLPHASSQCVFVFHDVLHWHMLDAFNQLQIPASYERRVLTRCPSGLGIVFPSAIDAAARDAIDAFCDDTVDLTAFHASIGATSQRPGDRLAARLSRGWRRRHVGMAVTCEVEGNVDGADRYIALAIADADNDPEGLLQIAGYYTQRERWPEALQVLEQVTRLAPTCEHAAHETGRVLKALGRTNEALERFSDACDLNTKWAAPLYERALIHYHQGNYAAAVADLEQTIILEPNWAAPWHLIGLSHARADGEAAAVPWYEGAIRRAPDHLHAHYDLGQAKCRLGDDGAAAPLLERALALDPKWALPCIPLGQIAIRAGDTDRAIARFEQAAQLDPNWLQPFLELGAIRVRLGDYGQAIASLERALELDPHCDFAHHLMGVSIRQTKGDAASVSWFERAIALAPAWDAPRYEIGRGLTRLGRWQDALVHLMAAAALGCRERDLWYDMGLCRRATGEAHQALEAFEAACLQDPTWLTPLKDVGMCLRLVNRLSESRATLTEAVRLLPDWAGAHFELGLTYVALHDLPRAEQHLHRAAALRPGWQAPSDALSQLRQTSVMEAQTSC